MDRTLIELAIDQPRRKRGRRPGSYDVIVVGAGSAGCVLAARLSQTPDRQVLLLETGPDYPQRHLLPPEIADGTTVAGSHDWGYRSMPGKGGRMVPLPRGRLVGGSSAVNGTFALRGFPEDYDEWAYAGNDDWSFADVLPMFRALETTLTTATSRGTETPARFRSAGICLRR